MTPSTDDVKFRRDVLLQEYLRLCAEIRSIEAANERIIALALTLISAGAAIGLAQNVSHLFFVLPVAFIGVVAFAGSAYMSIFSLAGYKWHLEELINADVAERVLQWEQLVPHREKRNLLGKLLLFIYFTVGVGVCSVSLLRIGEEFGTAPARAMLALVTALGMALFVGFRRMATALEDAYVESKRLHHAP